MRLPKKGDRVRTGWRLAGRGNHGTVIDICRAVFLVRWEGATSYASYIEADFTEGFIEGVYDPIDDLIAAVEGNG